MSAQSDDQSLHDDIILVSLGTRYCSYCANISRTYMINPTKQQEAEYKAVVAAQEAAIAALVEGATASSVFDAAAEVGGKGCIVGQWGHFGSQIGGKRQGFISGE